MLTKNNFITEKKTYATKEYKDELMIMIEPELFIDNILPSVGLYSTKLGKDITPGTHVIFLLPDQSEKKKCVGRIISCRDRMHAEIQLYESYDTWCENNRAKDTITDSWSRDLKEVVITDRKLTIESSSVDDIAFVFLEKELKNYEKHPPLHGCDNVFIVRYESNGKHVENFITFASDFLVPGRFDKSKIDPILVTTTRAMTEDFCKQVYDTVTAISYVIGNSLNRRSAASGPDGTISRDVVIPELVFQYIAKKAGKVISDSDIKKRIKYDAFITPGADYVKRNRSHKRVGISFRTEADIKIFLSIFGNYSIIGIRKSKPKLKETATLKYNDSLNILFPIELTDIGDYNGIQFLYCEKTKELTILADFSCFVHHPPPTTVNELYTKQKDWWYTKLMIGNPTDYSVNITNNNDNNSIIGIHFIEDNICYKTIALSDDGSDVKCVEVTSKNNNKEKWFPVERVQEQCQ